MHLIDSHCHLTSRDLADQIEAVLQRAADAGVAEVITVASDLSDAAAAIALSERHRQVHVVAGVHPHEAASVPGDWDLRLEELARRDDVHAVGEIGLDYHYDFSDRPSQARVFRRQLEIAVGIGKPVVIHCREAHRDVLAHLREVPGLPGVVFHCFSGSLVEAEELWERGYWISLTGVVTFRRSDELRRVASGAPADRLMIETDAPFLSPEPVRNRRPNEPAFLTYTAVCIARELGMTLASFAALVTANTRRFFSLPAT